MTGEGKAAAEPPPAGAAGGRRRFRAAAPPKDATGAAGAALMVAVLVVLASWGTLRDVRAALASLGEERRLADALLLIAGLAALFPLIPAARGRKAAREGRQALGNGDVIAARLATAAARTFIWITFGYAAAQILILLLIQFFIANDMAVSRIFFLLPQIWSSLYLIFKAFWINVYIF